MTVSSRFGACAFGALLSAALVAVPAPSYAQQISNAEYQVNVGLDIEPFAILEFLTPALLSLTIPPPGSTLPSNGVRFRVTGNAAAILTAEPTAFLEVPSEGHLGKAVLGAEEIGYSIELRFPRTGTPGSPVQIAGLPGGEPGPTTPPLEVDLTATGGQREGEVHLLASQAWTEHGGLPLPGIYVGQVTLTLTADNL